MANHTSLPIYKVAYDLLDVITDLSKNMPRDFKQSIGGKLRDECVEIVTLIFRANVSREKSGYLISLIERLQVCELLLRLSRDKRLAQQESHLGLPIGNLSSQFFANVYLNDLDQFIKHKIGSKHYVRYVDDFVLLHESPQWLNAALIEINAFLHTKLNARLNPKKTILQSIDRGVDFVGQVIKPWSRYTRKRTVSEAISRINSTNKDKLFEVANSYFGLMGQASSSHHDRATIANVMRDKGYCVNQKLTKVYRKSTNE